MEFDLIVRGAMVFTAAGEVAADVGIEGDTVAAVGAALPGTAREEIDATGLHVMPGAIDAHVHVNEPGRTEWEGFATASGALAIGGMSSFFDMPVNASPPTTTVEAFDAKLAAAERSSRLDFGLWGGIVPGNVDQIAPLHQRGVIGFKAFMCETGVSDFERADEVTLWRAMKRCADLGAIVAVHAEDQSLSADLTAQAKRDGHTTMQDYLDSRPPVVETRAIATAIELAVDTGCALHVVHVSTLRGLELVQDARSRGADVSAEVCQHYLTLTGDDMVRQGGLAKCSPPMRDAATRDGLWKFVASHPDAIVSSDHSPSPLEMKLGADAFVQWGGISGCQTTLGTLFNGCAERHIEPARAVAATTRSVADRFKLARKGAVEPGYDADLAVIDLAETWELTADELRYRHPHSPLVGQPLRGRVKWLWLRGQSVVADGSLTDGVRGNLLRPSHV